MHTVGLDKKKNLSFFSAFGTIMTTWSLDYKNKNIMCKMDINNVFIVLFVIIRITIISIVVVAVVSLVAMLNI